MTASCKHDWAINNHWDGMVEPAPYPIIQCIRCNETSAGAAPSVEALDRTSERRPLAHLLTADEYQAIRERNAVRQGEVRHGTGSDPVMDRDALIRHIDARAIEAERSAGVAPLEQLLELAERYHSGHSVAGRPCTCDLCRELRVVRRYAEGTDR